MEIEKRYVILEYDTPDYGEYRNRWETILPAVTTLDMAKGYAREEANRVSVDRHRVELTYLDCEIEENRPQYSIGTVLDGDGYNPIDYKPLPLYIYRGKVGVIFMNEFITEEQAENLNLSAENCMLCYDDINYNGNEYSRLEEITYKPIINDENEQKLTSQWAYVETAKEDYIKQRYLTITDSFYDWRSDITQCVERVEETFKTYEGHCLDKIEAIIRAYLSNAQEDINNCHPEVNVYSDMTDVINFIENQFESELKEYVKIIIKGWRLENDR